MEENRIVQWPPVRSDPTEEDGGESIRSWISRLFDFTEEALDLISLRSQQSWEQIYIPRYMDVFSGDVIFSVTTSLKGGVDIKIGSHTIHVPKYFSAHHPLIQMVLFARNWYDEDTFHCPKSMAPKSIVEMVKRSCYSASPNVYEAGWTSAKCHPESHNAGTVSEFTPGASIGGSNKASLPVLFDVSVKSEAGSTVSAKPPANKAQEDGEANMLSQPHYETCVTNENICKLSRSGNGGLCSEGTAWQLLQQDDTLTGGHHVTELIADGSFPVCQGTVQVSPAQESSCAASMNMEYKTTNEGAVDCGIDIDCMATVLAPATYLHVQHPPSNTGGEHSNNPLSSGTTARIISSAQKDVHELSDTEPEHHSGYDPCVAEHGINKTEDKTAATWLVASAVPHHATGNRSLISGFTPEHDLFVQAGDGAPMQVCGRGSVITDAVVLPDVWFVPGLTANLVSASQLTEIDYSIGFSRGICYIRNTTDGTVVGKAHVGEDGLFELDFLKVPLVM